MEFGFDIGYGKPLFVNGKIFGWVCESINNWYVYSLAGVRCDHSGYFITEREAEQKLMSIIGE